MKEQKQFKYYTNIYYTKQAKDEYVCSRCNDVIPRWGSYFRCEINYKSFTRTFRLCESCFEKGIHPEVQYCIDSHRNFKSKQVDS